MNRKEVFEWLDTCPTHKWESDYDEHNFVSVNFPIEDDLEECE